MAVGNWNRAAIFKSTGPLATSVQANGGQG